MEVKLGINGFGRIGRLVMRASLEREDVEVLAINDPFIDVEYMKYMLTYDYNSWKIKCKSRSSRWNLVVNGKTVKVYNCKEPSEIPWKEAELNM